MKKASCNLWFLACVFQIDLVAILQHSRYKVDVRLHESKMW